MSYQAVVERNLVRAEKHVTKGTVLVERQRLLIARLERGGHDSAAARKLLAQFEEIQALHISDRDRLRRTIAKF